MEGPLKKKTLHGVSWSIIDNISSRGISFIVGIVLARLLSPKEYGLIGIIMIFIAILNSIVDSGFSSALIRKKNATNLDYNTVFIFNLILSFFIFWLFFFSAPFISHFFSQPELIPLTRAMGIIIIINALTIIQYTTLVKKVDFKTQTKISVIASSISGIIGIGMALSGFGVWSLVGQQISRQFLNSLLLWFFNKWRPSLQFSTNSFKELFSFGWKVLVTGLINTTWKEIYQVVIGKFYTPATLGQYTRAKGFSDIFASNITGVIQRVSYPVLSSIQDEKVRLKMAYKKLIKTTMLVSFVCILGLAAVARPMILVLIGEKWLPAVGFLQIICFSAMFYPLNALNLNMLNVQGRSDLFLKLEIIKKTIAVGPILLGIFIDINWMLWGSVLTGFIAYYLNSFYSGRELNYKIMEQIKDIFPSFVIAAVTSIIVWCISLLQLSPSIIFPIQLIIGGTIVLIMCEVMKREEYLVIKGVIIGAYHKMKRHD